MCCFYSNKIIYVLSKEFVCFFICKLSSINVLTALECEIKIFINYMTILCYALFWGCCVISSTDHEGVISSERLFRHNSSSGILNDNLYAVSI